MSWKKHEDNYWTFPARRIDTDDPANPITVRMMWTPEDGKRITADFGDVLATPEQINELAIALVSFAGVSDPEEV